MRMVRTFAISLCLVGALIASRCGAVRDFQPPSFDPGELKEDEQSASEAELGALMIRARYHRVAGEAEKARETYLQVISEFPHCAYAHFQLAGLLLATEERDARIQHLEKAIELDPTMKDAYELLGFCYTIEDNTEKAIATYKRAVENVEDNLSFYSSLAGAYLSQDKPAEAEDTLLEACRRHPSSPQSWFGLIQLYVSRREPEKADEAFEKALKATNNSLQLLRDARGLYRRWKDEEKALSILVRTLDLYPESPPMWLQLVESYLARGEKEQAKEATEKAIGYLRYNEDLFTSLAVAYIKAHDADSAIAVLTQATEYHAESTDIWRTLAGLYGQKGDTEKARECYRKILAIKPARLQERRLLALSYLADKNSEGAIRELREAIRIFPSNDRVHVELADIYLASGRFEEGEKALLDLIKARPGNSEAQRHLANYYLKADKPEKMQEALDGALQLETDPARQARILALLGREAAARKQVPLALRLLQEAAKRQPDSPTYAYALATAHLLSADTERAIEHLRRAVELAKPPNPEWLLTLGKLYRASEKREEAAETFSKAIALLQETCKKEPKSSLAWYSLGQAYETAENSELATEAYAKCVQLQPENGDLRYKLATVYSQLHWHNKAQKQLEKAVELPSPKPEWFLLLGEVYRTLAMRTEAARAFDEAIAMLREEQGKRPQDFAAWAALGEAQSQARQYGDAVESLRKAIELVGEKTDFRLRVALARALESSGQNEAGREEYLKALALLEKSAEEDPNDADNYLRLGLLYPSVREFGKSADALAKGLELAGGNASFPPRVALADSLEKNGKTEQAQQQYHKVYSLLSERIKEHPKDVYAHYLLANVCERIDKFEECERQYEIVMELDPFFAAAYNNLGYTWIERNLNLEEAMKHVRKALELDPDNGAYIDSLGWGYFKQGKLDEALAELQRALKFESTDPTIYDHIGDVYKAKSELKEAINYWRRALEMNPNDAKIKEKIEKGRGALPPEEEKEKPEGSE